MIEFKKQGSHTVPTSLKMSKEIRERIKQIDGRKLTTEEHDELAEIYQSITNHRYPAYNCSSCLAQVYKVVNNWMEWHEVRTAKSKRDTSVTFVQEIPEMTLAEMRVEYPTIRATSRAKFWAKVVEEGLNA